jgi:hypothetical protein
VRVLTPDRSLLSGLVSGRFLAGVIGLQPDIATAGWLAHRRQVVQVRPLNRRPRPPPSYSEVWAAMSVIGAPWRTVARGYGPRRPGRPSESLAPAGRPSPQYAATAGLPGRVKAPMLAPRSLQNRLWGGAEPSQVGWIPIRAEVVARLTAQHNAVRAPDWHQPRLDQAGPIGVSVANPTGLLTIRSPFS